MVLMIAKKTMTKKSFIIILILSVISTYIAAFIDALISNTLLGGSAGLPFKFASGTLFGEASTNYLTLFLNIAFWFMVIWGIWKLIKRVQGK